MGFSKSQRNRVPNECVNNKDYLRRFLVKVRICLYRHCQA